MGDRLGTLSAAGMSSDIDDAYRQVDCFKSGLPASDSLSTGVHRK